MIKVKELITDKIDICLISEIKLDQSFPNLQFQIHGYKMFRRDMDKYGGRTLFGVNENIPSKFLHVNSTPDDNEVTPLEFSIKGLRWLCIGVKKQNDKYLLNNLSKNFAKLTYCMINKLCSLENSA